MAEEIVITYNDEYDDPGASSYAMRSHHDKHNNLAPGEHFNAKVPPALDGSTSWFTYEERVSDWEDITQIDQERRGPLLKQRVSGPARIHIQLIDKEKLKNGTDKDTGVKYFLDTLRPHFVKSVNAVFLWRFFKLLKFNRGHQDMHQWIGKILVVQKQAQDAWMDLKPVPDQTSMEYKKWIAETNENALRNKIIEHFTLEQQTPGTTRMTFERPEPILAENEEHYERYKVAFQERHMASFPISNHLMSLMFIVFSDLNEQQRDRLTSFLHTEKIDMPDYRFEKMVDIFVNLYCTSRTGIQDPFMKNTSSGPSSGIRSFFTETDGVLTFNGTYSGWWAYDEETGEQGLLEDIDNTFWVFDDAEEIFKATHFKGRNMKKGKGKGKGKKGKGKGRGHGGRRYFKPRKGKGKGKWKGKGYEAEGQPNPAPFDGSYKAKGKGKFKGKFKGKGKDWHDGKGPGPPPFGGAPPQANVATEQPQPSGEGQPQKEPPSTSTQEMTNEGSWHDDSWWYDNEWSTPSAWWGSDSQPFWQEDIWTSNIASWQDDYSFIASGTLIKAPVGSVTNQEGNMSMAFSGEWWKSPSSSWLSMQVVDLLKSPLHVILDLGCTRPMGSRKAVMRFYQSAHKVGLKCWFEPVYSKFKFADSKELEMFEALVVQFPTTPNPTTTAFDICEQGDVPILFSVYQMMNLGFKLDMSPHGVYLTCEAMGYDHRLLPWCGTGHLVLNLGDLKSYAGKAFLSSTSITDVDESGEALAGTRLRHKQPVDEQGMPVTSAQPKRPPGPAPKRYHPRVCDKCQGRRRVKGKDTVHTWSDDPYCFAKHRPADHVIPDYVPKDAVRGQPAGQQIIPGGREATPTSVGGFGPQSEGPVDPMDKEEPPLRDAPALQKSRQTRTREKKLVGGRSMAQPGPDGTHPADMPIEVKPPPVQVRRSKASLPAPEDAVDGVSRSLARLHERLKDPSELLRLHLKHFHMSTDVFKKRTSALKIPKEVYDLYDQIVKKCEACALHKPAAPRQKVSGLRAKHFGDLIFIDHCDLKLFGLAYVICIVYDAASCLTWACPQKTKAIPETLDCMRSWMDELNCTPRAICGDQYFHQAEFLKFYQHHNIKAIATGPMTPWPNRAETAVRLFKRQMSILCHNITEDPTLKHITVRTLCRRCTQARNTSLTYGGKSPLEIAFGRRPPDILDVENMDPGQLTGAPPSGEETQLKLQRLAMQSHLEARQASDLRQDIARQLRPSSGVFSPGHKVWYWEKDPDDRMPGRWYRGKVTSCDSTQSMVYVDLGFKVIKANVTKLRFDPDELHDFILPPVDDEAPAAQAAEQQSEAPPVQPASDWTSLLSFVSRGQIDMLELFSGSQHLSHACSSEGLSVGQPIDLRTGFDMSTTAGQDIAWKIIHDQQPSVVWLQPRASWKRDYDLSMTAFCTKVAWYQMQKGRHFVLENPRTSEFWNLVDLVHLSESPNTTWDTLDMTHFGMSAPTDADGSCMKCSLMHNFPDKTLAPLFFNDGTTKTGFEEPLMNKTPYAQVYPKRFCRLAAKLIATALHSVSEFSLCVPEDSHSTFVENRQLSLIDDLLEIGEFSLQDDCALLSVLNEHGSGLIEGVELHTSFNTELVLGSTASHMSQEFMNMVNSLPNGAEVVLHKPESKFARKLVPYAQKLRRRFVPSKSFQRCVVLRGTQGSVPLAQRGTDTYAVMWKKGKNQMKFIDVNSADLSHIVISEWSMLLFWESDGVKSDVGRVVQRPPRVFMPGPPIGDGPSRDEAPPGLPPRPPPVPPGPPGPPRPPGYGPYGQSPPSDGPIPGGPPFLPGPPPWPQGPAPPGPHPSLSYPPGPGGYPPAPPGAPMGLPNTMMSPALPPLPPMPPMQQIIVPNYYPYVNPLGQPVWVHMFPQQSPQFPWNTASLPPVPPEDHQMDQQMSTVPLPIVGAYSDPDQPLVASINALKPQKPDKDKDKDAGKSARDKYQERTKYQKDSQPRERQPHREPSSRHRGEPSQSPKPPVKKKKKILVEQEAEVHHPGASSSTGVIPLPLAEEQPIPDDDDDEDEEDQDTEEYDDQEEREHNGDTTESETQYYEPDHHNSAQLSACFPTYYAEDPCEGDVYFETGDDTVDDHWHELSEAQKCWANAASFATPCDIHGQSFLTEEVYTPPWVVERYGIGRPTAAFSSKTMADIVEDMSGITADDKALLVSCFKTMPTAPDRKPLRSKPSTLDRKRKEASAVELRSYRQQFLQAKKDEIASWLENEVYELVDMRKHKVKNYVTGRWVLVVKKGKDGTFLKCKARWVLRGFQDRQKDEQQTDSPTATRPGFRLACQYAANNNLDIRHIDLKTAFLQGQAFDASRDVVCQLPPEAGHPAWMGARMVKPAYGLNDAPRRWWNKVDEKLLSYGMIPTRADRCCYVLYSDTKYSDKPTKQLLADTVEDRYLMNKRSKSLELSPDVASTIDTALDYLTDPVSGSPAAGRVTSGVLCLHVDDLFMAGDGEFQRRVIDRLKLDFKVGSEDLNTVEFCGQNVKWVPASSNTVAHISISQTKSIDELREVEFDHSLRDDVLCDPHLHTEFRSVLGMINWLQSRTQFQACYEFSRCASASAAPKIQHLRQLNKLVRTIKARPIHLRHFPLKGQLRIVGYPDASYRNNSDKSSQRGLIVCLAEPRTECASSRGCIIAFESQKIKRTTLSTTVAELYAFMKVYGTTQFLRGLWMDVSSQVSDIHMRTDANNLVTTAHTTHLPEQQETIHMIQMLRKESVSGNIKDLGHVRTADMLADCLTKHSAKPDVLITAVDTGILPNVDASPSFRTMIKHKAYVVVFLSKIIDPERHRMSDITHFMDEEITGHVASYLASPATYHGLLGGPVGSADKTTATSRARWHTHVCNCCEKHFTHFHDHDDFVHTHKSDHVHTESEFPCCFIDCRSWYGASAPTQHNPLHCRPERTSG